MERLAQGHLQISSRPLRPSTFDAVLSGAAMVLACLEATWRHDLVLPTFEWAAGVAVGGSLWLRRVRPFAMFLIAFGFANALSLTGLIRGTSTLGLSSMAVLLFHPASLARYGAPSQVSVGVGVLLLTYAMAAMGGEMREARDFVGALGVLLFPLAVGATFRFRDLAHRQEIEQAQLLERQLLARELHDTVAHHLSAIHLQTQAARAVLNARPDAVATSLEAIESEATRALKELRFLVGALRADEGVPWAPAAHERDLEALVREAGRHATFEREGDVRALSPAVVRALHRITRESLHNIRKHAQGSTHIRVRLVGEGPRVRLTIRNDGLSARSESPRRGFGLVGMKERAALVGGTLEAGPLPSGGWQVEALLPQRGLTS